MGHDMTAYSRSGAEYYGPHFSRYWWPHYEYLDAQHHNDGISGDGRDEEMTTERLQIAMQRVEEDLSFSRESLRQIEDRIRGFQANASAELSKLVAQRQVLHAGLQASEKLCELTAQLEPIVQERQRYSPMHEGRAKMPLREWAKSPDRAEWSRLGERAGKIQRHIDELRAPLSEIEARIAELEPFVSNFERAVLEKQKQQMLEHRKPGVRYILAPCQGDPEGEWEIIPLQDLISSGVDDDDEEEKPKAEGLVAVQHQRGCKQTIKDYEELRDFFNLCIEADVVRIRFW